jgi:O-antigen/teichoic acid export membrane protein
LTVLVCAWLVPSIGLQGAVIALLVSGIAQAVLGLAIVVSSLRRMRGS